MVIFSGDVQSTSIAIFMTVSVLCSLVVLVLGLATEDPSNPRPHLLHVIKKAVRCKKYRNKTNPASGECCFACHYSVESPLGEPCSRCFLRCNMLLNKALDQNTVDCSDITNNRFGISGETVPGAGTSLFLGDLNLEAYIMYNVW